MKNIKRPGSLGMRITAGLAAFVMLIVSNIMIIPAAEIENSAYVCGLEEHTHGEECYETSESLVCGLEDGEENADGESHTHGEECYTVDRQLICPLEEHTHSEECMLKDNEEGNVEVVGEASGETEPAKR